MNNEVTLKYTKQVSAVIVSDIAIFVLKRDVKLQLTNSQLSWTAQCSVWRIMCCVINLHWSD